MSHPMNIAMHSYILVYKHNICEIFRWVSTKHASSNHWLLSQTKACTTLDDSFPKTTRISHLMKQFVNISLSSLEKKSTLLSRYDMHVTHNRPTQVNTHACANYQHSQVDNIHVNKAINQHKPITHACSSTMKLSKIPLFTQKLSCMYTMLNSLASTRIPFACTST